MLIAQWNVASILQFLLDSIIVGVWFRPDLNWSVQFFLLISLSTLSVEDCMRFFDCVFRLIFLFLVTDVLELCDTSCPK